MKTPNRESESELKERKTDNAQFSLCCTSTAMPDDDSLDRHPAFCFSEKLVRKAGSQEIQKLLFQARNMPSGKPPLRIALDQRVRELHDSIERFAVHYSLYTRLSKNNGHVASIQPR